MTSKSDRRSFLTRTAKAAAAAIPVAIATAPALAASTSAGASRGIVQAARRYRLAHDAWRAADGRVGDDAMDRLTDRHAAAADDLIAAVQAAGLRAVAADGVLFVVEAPDRAASFREESVAGRGSSGGSRVRREGASRLTPGVRRPGVLRNRLRRIR